MLPSLNKSEKDQFDPKRMQGHLDITPVEDQAIKNYFAFLPQEKQLQEALPGAYVINKPMQGVGGDGYWLHTEGDVSTLIVFDCMGHGHLASMMTRFYLGVFKRLAEEQKIEDPAKALVDIHEAVVEKFPPLETQRQIGTGSDIAIVKVNRQTKELIYAGSRLDLCFAKDKKLECLRGGRIQIGEYYDYEHKYTSTKLETVDTEGVRFYLATDGLKDMIGGPHERKLGSKNVKSLLESVATLPVEEQKLNIQYYLQKWGQSYEQMDDLLLVSFSL